MRALDRKLVRQLWRMRAQVASIAAVLAGGMMTVVSMQGTAAALERSRAAYYRSGRFADLFATVTRAPDAMRPRLAGLPGVRAVTTRVVKDVRLEVPGLDRPGTGHLVSLPARDEVAPLNAVRVLRGRMPGVDSEDEVLVSGRFADVNHLQPGDSLVAVVNERRVRLRIVGVAGAPDFLYEEANVGMLVDERAYGILWAPSVMVAAATGMRGAFTDVALTLAPGASEPAVRAAVDSLLAPYGSRGAIGRADQPSHAVVQNELHQVGVIGLAFPVFLVGVAAFLSGTVLTRLIATEREQIAVLKAFGYTDAAVGAHYTAFAVVAVAAGLAVGVVGGIWFGHRYTDLYGEALRIPGLRFRLDPVSTVRAGALLALATLAGATRAVRAAARLAPAVALLPPAPAHYHKLLLDRLGLGTRLPAVVRMVLRGVERYPARAMLGAAGVAAALAMIVGAFSLYDAADAMIDISFRRGHRETIAVQLVRAVPRDAAGAFTRLPGVSGVQLARLVPVRLRHGGHAKRLAITGVDRVPQIGRIVDDEGLAHAPPPDGIVLDVQLARALAAKQGDTVDVELLERLATRRVVVAAVFNELVSPNAYMDLGALERLVGDGAAANAAYLLVAGPPSRALYDELREMPNVAGVTARAAMLENFDRMMARGFRITSVFVVTFAALIAVGVVYNSARIALSERSRELASLRVLGFTTGETGAMLLGEQALLTVVALPVGWALGWVFARYLVFAFASDRFRVPLVSQVETYEVATVAVILAAFGAGALMYRRVARLDLISVLKTRE